MLNGRILRDISQQTLCCPSVQSKSLFNVRSAFKLMQHDLDPLLQGELFSHESASDSLGCYAISSMCLEAHKLQRYMHRRHTAGT